MEKQKKGLKLENEYQKEVETVDLQMYEIPVEKVIGIFDSVEDYGIVGVEVENVASILDDMLQSEEEKLSYAREKLEEGNIDGAVMVVKGDIGTLIIKIENVVEIRIKLREYKKLIENLNLER